MRLEGLGLGLGLGWGDIDIDFASVGSKVATALGRGGAGCWVVTARNSRHWNGEYQVLGMPGLGEAVRLARSLSKGLGLEVSPASKARLQRMLGLERSRSLLAGL